MKGANTHVTVRKFILLEVSFYKCLCVFYIYCLLVGFVRIRNVANNLYLSVQKPSDVVAAVDCSLQTYNVTLREGNYEHDETQYWKIRDLNLGMYTEDFFIPLLYIRCLKF